MTTKFSVAVIVDMDAAALTLRPAGRFRPERVRAVLAVVGRAGRVLPGFVLHLDLGQLRTGSAEALQSLSRDGVKTLTAHHPMDTRHGDSPNIVGRAAA